MNRPVCAACGAPRPTANASWPVARCDCGSNLIVLEETHVHTEAEDFAALIPPPRPLRIIPSPTPRRRA